MLRCGLSGQLDHDIRLLAQRLHGRDLGFRLREPTIRAAELRQLLRILRIRRDVARRQNEVIVQGETSLAVAPEAVETSVDAVRMFPAVRQAAEGVHVVLESAIIIAVDDGELFVGRMVERTAAVDTDRIRRPMRSQSAHRTADLVVHAAVADAERRAAMSDEHFIVRVIVVQRLVGKQEADIDLRSHAVGVVDRMLCAVAVASRRFAAVVLGIDDGRRRLAVLNVHGHVARAKCLARAERTDGTRAAEITDRIERRFQIFGADDFALLEARQEAPRRRILEAALVVESHLAIAAGNDLDDDIAVCRLLRRQVGGSSRIAVAAAIRRDLILQIVESRQRRFLADPRQEDIANLGVVELDLILDIKLDVLHQELHIVRRLVLLHGVLDARLRSRQRSLDILPGF